ncbi:ABC transporter permease [Candidatus Nitrosacidococcus sp. I8]|uniref:ABC transporter permease n=1 Tax=Candidatus Nitrosacidococcus sp. I8 TaxID=2942908 RepID=UPI002226D69E|nr:ABC transporter permease [Candidatus Nitrosacidococcus sp. I8]CAH9017908.1 putative iron export permease protein FetB [Candidatus Nitrosacidococcus sp. I8]
MNSITPSYFDLAIASILILLNGGLSFFLGLKLERSLIIASFRMVLQLAIISLVLKKLFTLNSPVWISFIIIIMMAFAGWEILVRQTHRLVGWRLYGLGAGSILLATSLITLTFLATNIHPDPWYDPRYLLPLLGMVLGNTMTGISLGLHNLFSGLIKDKISIENQLALGATYWIAVLPIIRNALQSALMPTINAMAATGLVWFPGMMTGQILAGVYPTEAVKYQILIMFFITGSTGFGSMSAVIGGAYWLTDSRDRLRLDRFS